MDFAEWLEREKAATGLVLNIEAHLQHAWGAGYNCASSRARKDSDQAVHQELLECRNIANDEADMWYDDEAICACRNIACKIMERSNG